jgi:hypothetical protein
MNPQIVLQKRYGMDEVELNRPSIERISISPSLITCKGSEEGASPELEPLTSTENMEVIEISSDEEQLSVDAHESLMEDDTSDDTSDDTDDGADLDHGEAGNFINDTATGMDVENLENNYGDEHENDETAIGDEEKEHGEYPTANFIGILESQSHHGEVNIDAATLAAAVRGYGEDTQTLEIQSDDFEFMRSGYQDAYSINPNDPAQSSYHGNYAGGFETFTQCNNIRASLTGHGGPVHFREHEGHAWNFNRISPHSNEETNTSDLIDTQDTKEGNGDVPFASHAPIHTGKKKQIQSIDLTESDDEVENGVQIKQQINIASLMQIQNSPLQGIQATSLVDRSQVHFMQRVQCDPKSKRKTASPTHAQLMPLSVAELKTERKVDDTEHITEQQIPQGGLKVFPKPVEVAQPKVAVKSSALPLVANSASHPSGHESTQISLADLPDVQSLRNLINCTLQPPNLYPFICFEEQTYHTNTTTSSHSRHIHPHMSRPLYI